jgi:protein SCO1/2
MNRNRLLTLLAILVAVPGLSALVLFVAIPQHAPQPIPESLRNTLLPEPRPLDNFSLTDMNGRPFNAARLEGGWSFLFFGYTHCPDICPTTLTTLKATARQLQQDGDGVQDTRFIFVSVDPKRDSLAHLKEYISYFHPDFLAVTGKKEQIDTLARQAGAIYMFDGDTDSDEYIVNHSATILLIDPQGRWVGRFNPPHSATRIADNFHTLRTYFLNN